MELSAVTLQNPWWKDRSAIEKDPKVITAFNSNPPFIYGFLEKNLLLLGPRQAGKTTFLKLAMRDLLMKQRVNPRNVLFLSCDLVNNRDEILQALQLFEEQSDRRKRRYVFLDEISFVRDWNVLVLGLFNSGFLNGKVIYLTGSSSVSLLKETFPGRDLIKVVFLPLQFRDYFDLFYSHLKVMGNVDIKNVPELYRTSLELAPFIDDLNEALMRYVQSGGLLAPSYELQNSGNDPIMSLFETYRDAIISDIAKLERSQRYFREIAGILVSSYASRISANSVAQNTSIGSHKTVESYLELMEQLFLIRIVYMLREGRTMYRSNKKIYFTDPFFYRVLKLHTTGVSLFTENEISKVVEGVVGMHLMNGGHEVNYVHAKNGKEVDFVMDGIGIEVKWSNRDLRDLYWEEGYLLTKNAIPRIEGKRASIPLSIFLYLVSFPNQLR